MRILLLIIFLVNNGICTSQMTLATGSTTIHSYNALYDDWSVNLNPTLDTTYFEFHEELTVVWHNTPYGSAEYPISNYLSNENGFTLDMKKENGETLSLIVDYDSKEIKIIDEEVTMLNFSYIGGWDNEH